MNCRVFKVRTKLFGGAGAKKVGNSLSVWRYWSWSSKYCYFRTGPKTNDVVLAGDLVPPKPAGTILVTIALNVSLYLCPECQSPLAWNCFVCPKSNMGWLWYFPHLWKAAVPFLMRVCFLATKIAGFIYQQQKRLSWSLGLFLRESETISLESIWTSEGFTHRLNRPWPRPPHFWGPAELFPMATHY